MAAPRALLYLLVALPLAWPPMAQADPIVVRTEVQLSVPTFTGVGLVVPVTGRVGETALVASLAGVGAAPLPGVAVDILVDGALAATTRTDATGDFAASFASPSLGGHEVVAVALAGSPAEGRSAPRTLTSAPPAGPVTGLVSTVVTWSRVDVTWAAPASDGGAPVERYVYSAHDLLTGAWRNGSTWDAHPYFRRFTDASGPARTIEYTVRAVTAAGMGAPATVLVTTPAAPAVDAIALDGFVVQVCSATCRDVRDGETVYTTHDGYWVNAWARVRASMGGAGVAGAHVHARGETFVDGASAGVSTRDVAMGASGSAFAPLLGYRHQALWLGDPQPRWGCDAVTFVVDASTGGVAVPPETFHVRICLIVPPAAVDALA